MKIKRETDTQLILEQAPWLMGIVIILMIVASLGMGGLFVGLGLSSGMMIFTIMGIVSPLIAIGMGGMALRVFVKRTQAIFDRDAGTITIRKRGMRGYSEVVHDLAHLGHAVLRVTRDSEGRALSRPVLVLTGGMSAGDHPLVDSFTTGTGPRTAVNAINRWIENGSP